MPDKEKLLRIIKQREKNITEIPRQFIDGMESTQSELYRELQTLVKEMDTKGNRLQNNRFNISMLNRMRDKFREWLRDAGYYEQITEFGKSYKTILDQADSYFMELGFEGTLTDRDLNTLRQITRDDLSFMRSRDKDVLNTTYETIVNGIHSRRDWRDLDKALRDLHTDTKEARGLLKRYIGTYSNTAFAAFDRRVMQIKANQFNIDLFLFAGSSLKDSREFCMQRVDKVFTRDEINAWQEQQWQGKKRGGNVWIYLGGYNCTHSLNPISEEMAKEFGYAA